MKKTGSTSGRVVYRRWRFGDFEYRSDLIAHDYMRRWMIKVPRAMVRLHHILRGDSDVHYHDHPIDFCSLIVRGGYIEYTPDNPPRVCRPGDLVFRRAEDLHYIKLIDGPAWTLLVTSPFRRDWGFQTEHGWVVAGEYDAYLAWRAAHGGAANKSLAEFKQSIGQIGSVEASVPPFVEQIKGGAAR